MSRIRRPLSALLRFLLPLPVVAGLLAFGTAPGNEAPRAVSNTSFGRGESLKYKVHYGIINAAEGSIETSNDILRVNDRPCYRVNVSGRTVGSFDFFLRIRDTWRSYIDTTAILPQKFFRNIEEGKYRKKETVDFDHSQDMATVESSKQKDKKQFRTPNDVQDLVSGVFYIRTLDYSRRRVGEEIAVKGFFDEEVFDFTVRYQGRTTVDTKAGKFRVIKLTPKMPANKLFDGEDAIAVYLSDDENKVPVLIQAEMFVGSVKLDLYDYSGVRSRLNKVAD